MKHLLLLFSVLLVSLQQPLCAATHETTSTPDSVSLFAYATRGTTDEADSALPGAWTGSIGLRSGRDTVIFVVTMVVGDRRKDARPEFETTSRRRMALYLEVE